MVPIDLPLCWDWAVYFSENVPENLWNSWLGACIWVLLSEHTRRRRRHYYSDRF